VTRFLRRLLLVTLATGTLGFGLAALGVAPACADDGRSPTQSDRLGVAHHGDTSIMPARSRLPVPTTIAVMRWSTGTALVADPARTPHAVTQVSGTPLYALLRVFRL
jgi:hypothetical protein